MLKHNPRVPYFEDFPSDVLLAVLTLDAEHGVVVQLTIGDPIPGGVAQNKKRRKIT